MVYFLYFFLILWCITESADLKPWKWYSQETNFSDWRNAPPMDYSSNAVVANYYSGGRAKYLRAENLQEIQSRLAQGDTLLVGLDYYSLYAITLPLELSRGVPEYLANGGVYMVRLTK